jgi:hypothetical protein
MAYGVCARLVMFTKINHALFLETDIYERDELLEKLKEIINDGLKSAAAESDDKRTAAIGLSVRILCKSIQAAKDSIIAAQRQSADLLCDVKTSCEAPAMDGGRFLLLLYIHPYRN